MQNPIERMVPPESWDTFSQHQAAHNELKLLRYLGTEIVRVAAAREYMGLSQAGLANLMTRLIDAETIERVGNRIRLAQI